MKNAVFVLLIFTNFLNGQTNSEQIAIEVDSMQLKGTLLYPENSNPIPVVLIISGSGSTDRDGNNRMMKNNSLKMIAEGFAQTGIATLRYDKRGVAESSSDKLEESKLRFETYVNDAKAWAQKLQKDPRFTEIIVLGHSEGSTIGMIVAQVKAVSKFISVAGPGDKASSIIIKQIGKQTPGLLEDTTTIIKQLEEGNTVTEVHPFLMSLFRPSVQPYLISWFKYDPKVEIAKLQKPVLIVQGTTDIQVDVSDANMLYESSKNAQINILEGMNHVLKTVEIDREANVSTYGNPDLPLHEELLPILVKFISYK